MQNPKIEAINVLLQGLIGELDAGEISYADNAVDIRCLFLSCNQFLECVSDAVPTTTVDELLNQSVEHLDACIRGAKAENSPSHYA